MEEMEKTFPALNSVEKLFEEKFRKSALDQTKDYPMPIPVVNLIQNGETKPLLTLKSFSLWTGKQKAKKTTLLAMAISAFIKPTQYNNPVRFESALQGVVLFFDNEQGEAYGARTMKLILKLAGLDTSSNLIYCDLRPFSASERLEIIKAGIRCTPNVRLVVIDGLVDLMTDFMDPAEGHMTITTVIQICSEFDIHVAGVLHQNKADKNARAHVGSISSQKCEIEISTEVDNADKSRSLVTCVNSRGLGFDPFAIEWRKGSLPEICQEWSESGDEPVKKKNNAFDFPKETHLRVLAEVFRSNDELKYESLWRGVKLGFQAILGSMGDNKAKDFVAYYSKMNWFKKVGGDKNPKAVYRFVQLV